MLISLLGNGLVFFLLVFGLGWPLAARWTRTLEDTLIATVALSLLILWLAGWLVYTLRLPLASFWILPGLALGGLIFARRSVAAALQPGSVRETIVGQGIVAVWCLGWLALIASYSGGGWAADWFEHWERAQFFLERWPVDTPFLGRYALTARPPLANVVTGVLLQLTRVDFAHYQLYSTLLASLVFLPAALLARRWGGARAPLLAAVLFMVNPLFVQNATFAWTKLPAAFFVLAAGWFFLRTRDADAPRGALTLCAVLLAAGLLAHYSAGPYAVMLAVLWCAAGRSRWREAAWWRQSLTAAGAAILLLATWLGWAFATFGGKGTLLTSTSVTSAHVREGNQLLKIMLNIFDTIVPHFLRPLDTALITQRSAFGEWRDIFFQAYQLNIPFALGCVAWIVLIREAVRVGSAASAGGRDAWLVFVGGVVLLGIGVHGARDHWGLAHICLQALVLVGVAWIAARWTELGAGWRRALIAGALVDFVCGIGLHFAVQSFAIARWTTGGVLTEEALTAFNESSVMNLQAKIVHRLAFFGDVYAVPVAVVLALLAALLAWAAIRARAGATLN